MFTLKNVFKKSLRIKHNHILLMVFYPWEFYYYEYENGL